MSRDFAYTNSSLVDKRVWISFADPIVDAIASKPSMEAEQ